MKSGDVVYCEHCAHPRAAIGWSERALQPKITRHSWDEDKLRCGICDSLNIRPIAPNPFKTVEEARAFLADFKKSWQHLQKPEKQVFYDYCIAPARTEALVEGIRSAKTRQSARKYGKELVEVLLGHDEANKLRSRSPRHRRSS